MGGSTSLTLLPALSLSHSLCARRCLPPSLPQVLVRRASGQWGVESLCTYRVENGRPELLPTRDAAGARRRMLRTSKGDQAAAKLLGAEHNSANTDSDSDHSPSQSQHTGHGGGGSHSATEDAAAREKREQAEAAAARREAAAAEAAADEAITGGAPVTMFDHRHMRYVWSPPSDCFFRVYGDDTGYTLQQLHRRATRNRGTYVAPGGRRGEERGREERRGRRDRDPAGFVFLWRGKGRFFPAQCAGKREARPVAGPRRDARGVCGPKSAWRAGFLPPARKRLRNSRTGKSLFFVSAALSHALRRRAALAMRVGAAVLRAWPDGRGVTRGVFVLRLFMRAPPDNRHPTHFVRFLCSPMFAVLSIFFVFAICLFSDFLVRLVRRRTGLVSCAATVTAPALIDASSVCLPPQLS